MDREGGGCTSSLTQNTRYGAGPPRTRNLVDFAQKSIAHRYMELFILVSNFFGPRHLLGIKFSKSEDHCVEYKYKWVYGHKGNCWLVVKRHICLADISVFIPHPQEVW
jgi:hypothetical protein